MKFTSGVNSTKLFLQAKRRPRTVIGKKIEFNFTNNLLQNCAAKLATFFTKSYRRPPSAKKTWNFMSKKVT
jgi:hypothetical protein